MNGLLPLHLNDLGLAVAGQRLLGPITATIERSGISVILGPNGAGKTLLLKLLHGLLRPNEGQIAWGTQNAEDARAHQAMVFQRAQLLKRSVAANLDYALALKRCPKAERAARITAALNLVGLKGAEQRPAHLLSGGEQQRVALARAAVVRPHVLLLDEATANLDPATTRAFEEGVRGLAAQGVKIVMATHDLAQARRLADEVLFLEQGKLIEQNRAEVFFAAPSSRAAKAFLAGELIAPEGEMP